MKDERRRNVTKADLVKEISERTGLKASDVKAVAEEWMAAIKTANQNGYNVQLRDFGSFNLKKRAPKVARHLKDNTSVTITEHLTPIFIPSKAYSNPIKEKSGYAVNKKDSIR